MALLKQVQHWFLSRYRLGRRNIRIYGFSRKSPSSSSRPTYLPPIYPCVSECSRVGREGQTVVCDINATLLRSSLPFPFFMLVAFEGGSILRALILLLSYPILLLINHHGLTLRVMTFITFCGLEVRVVDTVARAVLPKFYLEDLNLHAYEVFISTGRRVVLTCMPTVMVESFLKEYLDVDVVKGTELHVVGGGRYFSGLTQSLQMTRNAFQDTFGDTRPDIAMSRSPDDFILPLSQEAYVVSPARRGAVLPRDKYPRPLVFHDGRLAFFPTPLAMLVLFLWLPIGLPLAIFRVFLGIVTPYSLSNPVHSASGASIRVRGFPPTESGGVLYVCTHRTLLDPVAVSTVLRRPITAVTYSLSRISELLAPIRTVRLTRDRETDGATMQRLLEEGDLAVCPEGTTCREPYLLRFSPLFAELTDEIVPVAVDVKVSYFYGTTASGYKWLDSLFMLMNPHPAYSLQFLPKLAKEMTCGGGRRMSCDVANTVQRELAAALGFQCTTLSRRDKYLMLAGNEGFVGGRGVATGS